MANHLIILKDDQEQQQLLKWYHWLHDEKQRGQRARLRRSDSVSEVLMQQGFYSLCKRLPRIESFAVEGLALVSGLLAWSEPGNKEALPELLGKSKEGSGKPIFSELRFQRLLASDSADDLFHALRRAIVQAGKTSDPLTLADSVLHWFQQQKHPDWYQGQQQWQYRFAKPYYTQII